MRGFHWFLCDLYDVLKNQTLFITVVLDTHILNMSENREEILADFQVSSVVG